MFMYMFLYLPFHYTDKKTADIISKLNFFLGMLNAITLRVKTLVYKQNTVCVLTEH